MKKAFAVILAWMMLLCVACCAEERVDSLTYAVYPYLPDPGYYRELIERRWAGLHPDIPLIAADWDCYTDGAPQYLLLARKAPYASLSQRDPLYARMEALAGNANNHVILTP